MVIACVALDSAAARRLTRAGLADSKSYGAGAQAHARRLELAAEIRACAIHVALEVVPVDVIDARVMRSELNALEREVARRLIAGAPGCHRVIADGKRMFAQLAAEFAGFESHDDGESVHAAVAAASVIAKTQRDELWHAIRDRYAAAFGEVSGGGYVNDGTRAFIRAYVERHGDLPPEARRSWPHPYVADLLPSLRNEGAQLSLF